MYLRLARSVFKCYNSYLNLKQHAPAAAGAAAPAAKGEERRKGGREEQSNDVYKLVLLHLHGWLVFSTYTLLVLFWPQLYHQARSLPTDMLRPAYIAVNTIIYVVQTAFRASAEEAIRMLNGSQLGGNAMKLSWGLHSADKQAQKNAGQFGCLECFDTFGWSPQDPYAYAQTGHPGYGYYQ